MTASRLPLCILLLASLVSMTARAATAPAVIDIHTHVFNAHDLPIGGIMRAQAIPLSVLAPVVEFIVSFTDDYIPSGSAPTIAVMTRDLESPLAIAEADKAAIRNYIGFSQL